MKGRKWESETEKGRKCAGRQVSKRVTSYELRVTPKNRFALTGRARKARYPLPVTRYSKEGFSLLEVMVAVVIMGFGLLAIMRLFPIGLRASRISQDTTVATFLAQQKTEELRNSRYDYIDDIPLTGTFAAPFDDFSWTKSVTKCEEVYTLSEVIVEVSYTPYGQGRRVKLVTFITDYRHH